MLLILVPLSAAPSVSFGAGGGTAFYTVDNASALIPTGCFFLDVGSDVWKEMDVYGHFGFSILGKSFLNVNPLFSPKGGFTLEAGTGISYWFADSLRCFLDLNLYTHMYNAANTGYRDTFTGLSVRTGFGWLFFRNEESGSGYGLNLILSSAFTGTSSSFQVTAAFSMDVDSYLRGNSQKTDV